MVGYCHNEIKGLKRSLQLPSKTQLSEPTSRSGWGGGGCQDAAASSQRRQEEAWTLVVGAGGDEKQMDTQGWNLQDVGILRGCGVRREKAESGRFPDFCSQVGRRASPGNTPGG